MLDRVYSLIQKPVKKLRPMLKRNRRTEMIVTEVILDSAQLCLSHRVDRNIFISLRLCLANIKFSNSLIITNTTTITIYIA